MRGALWKDSSFDSKKEKKGWNVTGWNVVLGEMLQGEKLRVKCYIGWNVTRRNVTGWNVFPPIGDTCCLLNMSFDCWILILIWCWFEKYSQTITNKQTFLLKRCGKGPNDTPIFGKETVNSRKVSVANSFLHNCFAALHSAPAQHANHCHSAPQTILSFIINAFHSMPCIWLSSLSKSYL